MQAAFLMLLVAPAMPPVPRVVLPDAPATGEALNDPAALAERIAKNSKSVSDRLTERTEKATLRDQKQVKDDLDALIKLLEPPPPPSSSSSSSPPPPKDDPLNPSGSSKKPPPPGDSKGQEPPPGAPPPKSGAEPVPKGGAAPGEPKSKAATLPSLPAEESLARDFWGHLPDASRQQMMQFYREQYMTKYKDLLSQYYQSLAEHEKKGAK